MSDQNEITFFAKTNFRNQERVFGIKTDDRRRHMYVIGKTGMGKTNLLENLAIQDIQKGHGIAFIDPHGDTAEKLIKAIPSNRINDVIYFNPADQDFPIAFNVLEKVGPEYRHLIASGLIGVFKKIWAESWGPRLEYILRNAILALLEYPGSTLLGVMRILVDKSYRDRVVEKVTDPVVKAFWVDEFTKWNDRVLQEVISPIQNKVGQFVSSSLIRNIIGQTVSSFDIRKVMDERKILILNLSKGRIGEDNSALLGAMMITKIQLAAMGRVDTEEENRPDFYLYVDEFQNFATESFANILSEARKYHLNLILANQYVNQIDEKVRDAIFGNAGSIISFRVGATDAEFLEKEFEPIFMMNDIVNLAKYQIYLKLMIDGIAGDAFSATTLPPIKLDNATNEEKIINASRERYTASREEVEEKIRRWSGMLSAEERQSLIQKSVVPVPAPRPKEMPPRQEKKMPQKPAPRPVVSVERPREEKREEKKEEKEVSTKPFQGRISPRTSPQASTLTRPLPEKPLSRPNVAPAVSPQQEAVYSPEEANTLLQQALQPSVSHSEVSEPVSEMIFEPPLAPKKESLVNLDEFEKTEQEETTSQEPASLPPVIAEGNEESGAVERTLYKAQCATCGTDIEVPFEPDGTRPTFCKDCLRDYQRATAKARNEMERKQPEGVSSQSQGKNGGRNQRNDHGYGKQRVVAPRSYASSEAPLSLNQVQHIEPKKFKALRQRGAPNLSEVRALIDNTRKTRGQSS
jgi:CxxC-x17-CxxC domain-containing protein